MQPMLPRDMLEGIRAKLRQMVGRELIGADAWYEEEDNDVTALADGKLTLVYDYTPTPPLENLKLRQRQTDRYLVDFAAQVNA